MHTVIPIFEQKVEGVRLVSSICACSGLLKVCILLLYESRNFVGGVVFSVYVGGGNWVLYCADDFFVDVYEKVLTGHGGAIVGMDDKFCDPGPRGTSGLARNCEGSGS